MEQLLFNRNKLHSFKTLILKVAGEKIKSISASDVESTSLEDLKERLQRQTMIRPVFFTDEVDLEYNEKGGRKYVTRYRMFTGDERLFNVEPSSSTFNPPRGEITRFEDKPALAFSRDFDLSTSLTDAVNLLEERMPNVQTFISNINYDIEELNKSITDLIESELPIRYAQVKKDIDDFNNLKGKI